MMYRGFISGFITLHCWLDASAVISVLVQQKSDADFVWNTERGVLLNKLDACEPEMT